MSAAPPATSYQPPVPTLECPQTEDQPPDCGAALRSSRSRRCAASRSPRTRNGSTALQGQAAHRVRPRRRRQDNGRSYRRQPGPQPRRLRLRRPQVFNARARAMSRPGRVPSPRTDSCKGPRAHRSVRRRPTPLLATTYDPASWIRRTPRTLAPDGALCIANCTLQARSMPTGRAVPRRTSARGLAGRS